MSPEDSELRHVSTAEQIHQGFYSRTHARFRLLSVFEARQGNIMTSYTTLLEFSVPAGQLTDTGNYANS